MLISMPAAPVAANIAWDIDQPGQANRGEFTGRRRATLLAQAPRWYAEVTLPPIIGEARVYDWRAFVVDCDGIANSFRVIACERPQIYVSQDDRKDHRWNVDLPVSMLTLLFTAGIIIRLRPEPFGALAYGTGLGSAGVLIISACLAWVKRGSDLFQPPEKPGG
jgi:hypothetical protein